MTGYNRQVEKLRKDAAGVARCNRFAAKTLAEVDHLDWSLLQIWERIRESRGAVASSRELLVRLQDQERRTR